MIENWDDHWLTMTHDPLESINDPQTWSDYVWAHTLSVVKEKIASHQAGYPGRSLRFLECGAGTAGVSRFIKKEFDFDVTILDNSEEAIKLFDVLKRKHSLDITAVCADIKLMPFDDNSFDIIYLGGVMEYLGDVELHLNELNRVLKPGGLLIFVTVPNVVNVQIVGDSLMYLKSLFSAKGSLKKLVPENASNWNADKYLAALKNCGFTDREKQYLIPFPQMPLPGSFKKIYRNVLSFFHKPISRFNRRAFALQRYFAISFLICSRKATYE